MPQNSTKNNVEQKMTYLAQREQGLTNKKKALKIINQIEELISQLDESNDMDKLIGDINDV